MKRRSFISLASLALPSAVLAAQKTISCRVLVVGAGGAGLCAALEASSRVRDVILIDKESFIGGDTLISGGYFNAPDPELQKKYGIADSKELFYQHILESANGKGNPKAQARLAEFAYPTLEWLKELGVVFEDQIYQIYGSYYQRCHKPILAVGKAYVQKLSEACLKNGVQILTSTRFVAFEKDADGGFTVQAVSGTDVIKILCRALVLAAGGFGANPRLLKRYVPDLNFYYSDSKGMGEVLESAMKSGVKTENMDFIECVPEGSYLNKYSARIYVLVHGMIFINEDGHRFANEGATRKELSSALIGQGKKKCFTIVDNANLNLLDKLQKKHLYQAYFAGQVWKADSIEALCEEINVPSEAVKRSLEEVPAQNRPKVGPFWAVGMYPWVHYTLGGIAIDEEARALDNDSRPIAGLYAAGQITGSIHGQNRLGGNGLTDAFVFGRIAGINAEKYAK